MHVSIHFDVFWTCARITVGRIRYCILAQVRLVVLNTVFSKGYLAPSKCGDFLDHGVTRPPKVPNCTIQSTALARLHLCRLTVETEGLLFHLHLHLLDIGLDGSHLLALLSQLPLQLEELLQLVAQQSFVEAPLWMLRTCLQIPH